MRTLFASMVILASFLTSQNITFQNLDIPVEINDEIIENPFFGGFNKPR